MGYNMTETKSGFDPIPSDRYTFIVDSATAEEYSKDGKDGHHIEVAMHIADGAFAKRKVWDHIYLPGALWRARQVLQAAGKTAETVSSNIEAADIAAALMGTTFSAWLESSKGTNGSPRNDLKEYTPIVAAADMSTESFERSLDRIG